MNEPKPATVKAGVGRVGKFHKIWVVPITAFIIGLWMVYAHWASQGPLIAISFLDAEGIEAGKTKVRAKNVEIGEVLRTRMYALDYRDEALARIDYAALDRDASPCLGCAHQACLGACPYGLPIPALTRDTATRLG